VLLFWGEFRHNKPISTTRRWAMKRKREEMKAELMAKAEEVIDELLNWHEGTEAPTLT
jgi:hypothetical protein